MRSGVLNSVHAFANDPNRGVFILVILVLFIGAARAVRAGERRLRRAPCSRRPRETGMLINNLFC